MKLSRRNRANEQRKAEERSGRKPAVSKYSAKVRRQIPPTAMSEQLAFYVAAAEAAFDPIERAQLEAAFPSLTGGEQ